MIKSYLLVAALCALLLVLVAPPPARAGSLLESERREPVDQRKHQLIRDHQVREGYLQYHQQRETIRQLALDKDPSVERVKEAAAPASPLQQEEERLVRRRFGLDSNLAPQTSDGSQENKMRAEPSDRARAKSSTWLRDMQDDSDDDQVMGTGKKDLYQSRQQQRDYHQQQQQQQQIRQRERVVDRDQYKAPREHIIRVELEEPREAWRDSRYQRHQVARLDRDGSHDKQDEIYENLKYQKEERGKSQLQLEMPTRRPHGDQQQHSGDSDKTDRDNYQSENRLYARLSSVDKEDGDGDRSDDNDNDNDDENNDDNNDDRYQRRRQSGARRQSPSYHHELRDDDLDLDDREERAQERGQYQQGHHRPRTQTELGNAWRRSGPTRRAQDNDDSGVLDIKVEVLPADHNRGAAVRGQEADHRNYARRLHKREAVVTEAASTTPQPQPSSSPATMGPQPTENSSADSSDSLTSTVDSLIFDTDSTKDPEAGGDNDDGIETSSASSSGGDDSPTVPDTINLSDLSGRRIDTSNQPENRPVDTDKAGASSGAETAKEANATNAAATNPNIRYKYDINMTEVDETFASFKPEEEVVELWQRMDKTMKKGVQSVIGSVVPFALNLSKEAKIGTNCSGAILRWILGMSQMKTWSMRMIDASGKPSAGILEGAMTMFGNYRECLKIRAPDDDEIDFAGEFREYYRGKYCVLELKPWLPQKKPFYNFNTKMAGLGDSSMNTEWYEKTVFDELSELGLAFNYVNIRYDVCLPSLCEIEDIQKVAVFISSKTDLKARVLRCEQEIDARDQTYDIYQIGWAILPILLGIIVILASLLSILCKDTEKPKRLSSALAALSFRNSVQCHTRVDYEHLADQKPLALYGLRFIFVMWFILVESAVNLKFGYLRELIMLRDLIQSWPLQFIINSTLLYDSIILITAFTVAYQNIDSNMKTLVKYFIDKYIRLMPSVMVVTAFTVLLPLAYRGPVWSDYVMNQSKVCQSNGWINVIFTQNFLPYTKMCLPQTWLVCVELQLILLTLPIIYLLNKNYEYQKGEYSWKTLPSLILLGSVLLGALLNFYSVYINQLPPTWLYTMADPDSKAIYFGKHMFKTWTHLSVFAIGILAGHRCRIRTRKSANSSPNNIINCGHIILDLVTAVAATVIMLAIIFSTYDWSLGELPSPTIAGLYDAGSRILWSLSLTWFIYHVSIPGEDRKFCCLSKLLGHPIMVALGKLSFLAYIIHPLVHTSVLAIQEQPIFSSWLMLFHIFNGNLILTVGLSILISLFVEMPIRNLFRRRRTRMLLGSIQYIQ